MSVHVLYQLGLVRAPEQPEFDGAWLWFEIRDEDPSDQPEDGIRKRLTSITDPYTQTGVWVAAECVELYACFATDEEVEVLVPPEALPRYLAFARAGKTIGKREIGGELPWVVHGPAPRDPNPELH